MEKNVGDVNMTVSAAAAAAAAVVALPPNDRSRVKSTFAKQTTCAV
jgi:hypothetical protein